jgi:hypothetical protein
VQSNNIVSFQIFMLKADKPRALDFYSIRWLPSQSMKGIVDKFRPVHARRLARQAEKRNRVRAAHCRRKRVAGRKTARHRPRRIRWLEERPATERHRLFSHGSGARRTRNRVLERCRHRKLTQWRALVARHATRPLVLERRHGRDKFWRGRPDSWPRRDVHRASDDARNSGNTYFLSLEPRTKYGAETDKRWPDVALSRLQSWGFNTIGNWSSSDLFRTRRVPYVATFGTPDDVPRLGDYGLFDYFDNAFRTAIRRQAEAGTREWKNDPWCLGYFVDNEITWDPYRGAPAGVMAAAAALNTACDERRTSRLRQDSQGKYATPEAWSRAWGIDAKSFDARCNWNRRSSMPPRKPMRRCSSQLWRANITRRARRDARICTESVVSRLTFRA